jgi:vacuolar protein sorting-associated protein 13A/C
MVDSVIVPILSKVLGDYFINFNSSNFKSNFFSGQIQLTNLIFNQKMLEGFSMPMRLKFGMLGNLTIQLPSLLRLTDGLEIQISNVFLCLEMLEVHKWNEDLVIKKY